MQAAWVRPADKGDVGPDGKRGTMQLQARYTNSSPAACLQADLLSSLICLGRHWPLLLWDCASWRSGHCPCCRVAWLSSARHRQGCSAPQPGSEVWGGLQRVCLSAGRPAVTHLQRMVGWLLLARLCLSADRLAKHIRAETCWLAMIDQGIDSR